MPQSEPDPPPTSPATTATQAEPAAFRDAEAWLAARGVERQPIVGARSDEAADEASSRGHGVADAGSGRSSRVTGSALESDQAQVTVRDASRLVAQSAADAGVRDADADSLPDPTVPRLEDDVAQALAFVRRSTAVTPQSEGRLRAKLEDRGWPAVVVDGALSRARAERLVDDVAMATALVDERRARGHAVARIRRDLSERGFEAEVLDAVLADVKQDDPEAAAFGIAIGRATGLTALPAETAFSRVVGYLARRGYPEGLARKVAREAVFTTRDDERVIGR